MPIRRPDTPKLKWVKFTRAKGKLYAYFNTGKQVDGQFVYARLPEYGSPEFFASYASYMGARTKRAKHIPTVAELVELYRRSDEWKKRATNSQRTYNSTLAKVIDEFGDFPLPEVQRSDIYRVLDEIPGGASRNLFVAVIGILFRYARRRGMTDAEPTKDIERFDTGQHEPWPEHILKAALASDDDTVRLATHLLYFTGQRIGDVVKMGWANVRAGRIELRQEKTGKDLQIHQHRDLRAELERTPKRGLTILAQANGKPWSSVTIRRKMETFAADLGCKVVPHGLRKNAVIALLEQGCTIPEVQAVTGQSVDMVMHYAARVDRGVLSEAAILKLERRR